MKRFGVSRVTVRQAIARLTREGLAVSKQGKGSFVAGPVVQHELESLRGFYDTLVAQGHAPQTDLLAFGPARTPADIGQLLRTGGQQAVYLKRIYSLHRRPFALARAWLPPVAHRVTWDEAARNPLYAILQNLLGSGWCAPKWASSPARPTPRSWSCSHCRHEARSWSWNAPPSRVPATCSRSRISASARKTIGFT